MTLRLLTDGPAARIVDGAPDAPLFLTCDHADNTVPASLGALGLASEDLQRHIAWDIGAQALALRLAERFSAPLVLCTYSRLVVDCNRYLWDPDAMPAVSDETAIPGNATLSWVERERRAAEIYRPYHAAVAATLEQRLAAHATPPLFLSVHSMTPRKRGHAHRPQEIGVCWTGDAPAAVALSEFLHRETGWVIGDNEPYAVDLGIDYTLPEHGLRRGLPCIQIEVRQDLLSDKTTFERIAASLGDALAWLIDKPELRRYGPKWLDADFAEQEEATR